MVWLDLLINGICLGGLYGVLGVGLALAIGVMRFVNISHGEFIVMAAFLGVFGSTLLPGVNPLWLILPVAIVFFFVGYGVQAVLFNRVITARDFLAPILFTFGFSIVLQNVMFEAFGTNVRSLTAGGLARLSIQIGSLSIGVLPLITLGLAILFFIALQLVISRTRFGRAVRATADNRDVARLMGVQPARIFNLTMGVALALASVAGLLLAMRSTFTPFSGQANLLVAFEVIVIGGFGSFWGALLGGF
ncbi:MAG TPA: branched-chain amino acid ABC transporter permease, partial [Stellaceae bacterium]|nr:branched-chain amino acid ABC transporter permease [Stellaceae bacterium]